MGQIVRTKLRIFPERATRRRIAAAGGFIAAASLLSASLAGCTQSPAATSSAGGGRHRAAAERIIVAVDRSESTDPFRQEQLDALNDAAFSAAANGAQLDVWVYDATAEEVFTPAKCDGDAAIKPLEPRRLSPDKLHPRRGTRPAALLYDIDRSLSYPDAPSRVRIILLTDGDNDYAADGSRLAGLIAALAARPGTSIAVLDVTPDNALTWESLLRPKFGARCAVATLDQYSSVEQQFLSR